MKVLLDECLPRSLKDDFAGHETTTVPEAGWSGMTNGELMKLASKQFDAFITIDKSLPQQQNLYSQKLIVILMESVDCRLDALRKLMPKALAALDSASPGQAIVINS